MARSPGSRAEFVILTRIVYGNCRHSHRTGQPVRSPQTAGEALSRMHGGGPRARTGRPRAAHRRGGPRGETQKGDTETANREPAGQDRATTPGGGGDGSIPRTFRPAVASRALFTSLLVARFMGSNSHPERMFPIQLPRRPSLAQANDLVKRSGSDFVALGRFFSVTPCFIRTGAAKTIIAKLVRWEMEVGGEVSGSR